MVKQTLHNGWKMREAGASLWYPASVPGSVYADLLAAGAMEDPYWKANEEAALRRMDQDYEYRTTFSVSREMLQQEKVLMRFDGLDTLADIYLNGEILGSANNMHRYWEFDVTRILHEEENELVVLFHSPTRYIKKAYEACRADGSSYAMPGFSHLRKAHCMFGWDWGPRLPDAGIFREAALYGIRGGRMLGAAIRQDLSSVPEDGKGTALVHITPEIEWTGAFGSTSYGDSPYDAWISAKLFTPEGTLYASVDRNSEEDSEIVFEITDPKLWWPNGFGDQPLYTIRLELEQNGEVLDTWERRIGLRTLTIERKKDEWGESFAHQVNGIAIFAMGADYIPEDNLLSRVNPERSKKLLSACVRANFNTIRVWGGGYYPDDWFFDLCDELGLIVWQDFMFSCAVYDLNEEFEKNIIEEVTQNIRRIRHHACLGLWCGNNEMEMFVKQGTWVSSPKQTADYIKMYEYIFPKLVQKLSPDVFYWPASPSSGGAFDEPNAETRGDVHYWRVWHGDVLFSAYRSFYFRYLSEFGFQAFPCMKTIESFTDDPEDYNIFSYIMEKHQRDDNANGRIMKYVSQIYKYPTDFDTLLYTSQLLQADAIRYGVEHFRRNRGRCMGTLYWQINDIWPCASWSSIDYYGRYKALQYYAGRFFAPLLLSCEEEGLLTQDARVNAIPYEVKKSFRLNVSNETRQERRVLTIAKWRGPDSSVKQEWRQELSVPALSSVWLEKISLPDALLYEDHVSYELYEAKGDGEYRFVSSGSVIFSLPKHHHFLDPQLTVSVNRDEITVSAKAYARSVEIRNENEDLILSDNYFDMEAGERTVKILSGRPDNLRVRSVYQIR